MAIPNGNQNLKNIIEGKGTPSQSTIPTYAQYIILCRYYNYKITLGKINYIPSCPKEIQNGGVCSGHRFGDSLGGQLTPVVQVKHLQVAVLAYRHRHIRLLDRQIDGQIDRSKSVTRFYFSKQYTADENNSVYSNFIQSAFKAKYIDRQIIDRWIERQKQKPSDIHSIPQPQSCEALR